MAMYIEEYFIMPSSVGFSSKINPEGKGDNE